MSALTANTKEPPMAADGLSAIDSTGVLTGNADLTCERETPNPGPVKHLTGNEHLAGANWDLYDAAFLAIAAAGFWLALS